MVLSARPSDHNARVIRRCRHHGEHLTSLRFYGNDATNLTFHQSLSKRLKIEVNTQRDVFACHRPAVILAVLILSLYSATRIAQQYLHALFSAKLLFIVFLNAELAYIVAGLVVAVLFNVAGRHLTDVAKHMRGIGISVLSYAAALHIEAWKAENLRLKH